MAQPIINKLAIELRARINSEIHSLYERTCKKFFDYLVVMYPADRVRSLNECKYKFRDSLYKLSFYNTGIILEEKDNNNFTVNYKKLDDTIYIAFDFEMISYYDRANKEICRFSFQEYEMAIAMLEKFPDLLNEVERIKKEIPEKYEISIKSAEIAKTSIRSLCNAYYSECDYFLTSQELTSEIIMRTKSGKVYSLHFIHKLFLKEPEKIVELIKKPEDVIDEGYRCIFLMEIETSNELDLFDWKWVERERLKEIQ